MAQQRSHVPKFGNWESDENVPYTAYFDKARKGRTGGKMINPNDPQENPDLLSDNAASAEDSTSGFKAKQEEPAGHAGARRAHDGRKSREDDDLKQFSDSPARSDNMNRVAGNESVPQRHGGRGPTDTHKRPARPSAGSDNGLERSPLHHHARISGRSSGAPSPVWEGKNSYESTHGTPARSRLRPKGDESPEKGPAVPKFGDWDENNPASADGYTHIFNKVREEKQIGAGKVPGGLPTESPYHHGRKPAQQESSMVCMTDRNGRIRLPVVMYYLANNTCISCSLVSRDAVFVGAKNDLFQFVAVQL